MSKQVLHNTHLQQKLSNRGSHTWKKINNKNTSNVVSPVNHKYIFKKVEIVVIGFEAQIDKRNIKTDFIKSDKKILLKM